MLSRIGNFQGYFKFTTLALLSAILFLALTVLSKYSGNSNLYILFTIVSTLLLFSGFTKNAIFFDAFIGVFFWLGYWLKFSVRLAFSNGIFNQAIGNFDSSVIAFDRVLLTASVGLFGFLLSSFFRRFLFNYPEKIQRSSVHGLLNFYKINRNSCLLIFILFIFFITITNAIFVIYQKGRIAEIILPFGFNGIYKLLLIFGLASVSALFLKFEIESSKKLPFTLTLIALFETFISSISLLSRGMILNSASLLYGILFSINKTKLKQKFIIFSSFLVICLFVISVLSVNFLRTSIYFDNYIDRPKEIKEMTASLFFDRWVGMEGIMAVSSYPHLGWNLWLSAWEENYDENTPSFFDSTFIESSYVDTDKSKHHFITLPGIIAFFFYPGSFFFLFFCMFSLGIVAATLEFAAYKFGGRNLILCSLFAQVIAYRFSNFGYVPAQSYLLFGSLCLTLAIVFLLDMFFVRTRQNNRALVKKG